MDAFTYLYPLVLFLFPFVGPGFWNIVFARVFLLLRYTFGVLVVLFSPVGENPPPKKPKSYTNKRTWTKTVRLHVYQNCNQIIKLYVNEVICMAEKKSQKLYKLTNKLVPRLSNYTNIRTAIRLSNLYVYKLIFLNEKIVKILCFSF